MKSLYRAADAQAAIERWTAAGTDLALRTYTSRLLGAEPGLVLHGGGNTSVKTRGREVDGSETDVLFVKGSGWDLASLEPRGLPGCRLVPLLRLAALPELSDEDMVRGLRAQLLDPASPTPSVEALLHALLPAKFVDHTHADAVLALVDQADSEARVRAIWPEALFVPYVMPGFDLCRALFGERDRLGAAELVILDKHGVFTWGDTAEQSYERMIAAVTRAEREITKSVVALRASDAEPWPAADAESGHAAGSGALRRSAQRAIAPLLRGALARRGLRGVVTWRDDPEILTLARREDVADVARRGTVTPDHVIRVKPFPALLAGHDAAAVEAALDEFERRYREYFASNVEGRAVTPLDPLPRVVLAPGLGAFLIGATRKDALVAGDLVRHGARVVLAALGLGDYRPVNPRQLFDVEYWSLEQAKLKVGAVTGGSLRGRVALITGAAAGIGRAVAAHFLALGAHVLITDRDAARLEQTRAELARRAGVAVAATPADVADDATVRAAFDVAIDHFGGVDVVVSNAGTAPSGLLHTADGDAALRASLDVNLLGHQRVASAAARHFISQGAGGCLLFNASKAAFAPGPEFGPYAVAKAGVVALMRQYAIDLGRHAVRTAAVNADRVRTDLFGGGVLEARARARGLEPDEYFRQNLLARETLADDVAEAFAYLATAAGTTGAVVTVDGGNPAAFPR